MYSNEEAITEKNLIRSISGIIRATRKQLGLSQVVLSQQMGISQGALSKIESGLLTLSAPQWIHFCQITGVQLNSAVRGYVDFQEPAALRNVGKEHGFRLPSPYAQARGSKVRTLLPLMTYFRSVHSESGWKKYLESRELDPDFFLNLNNQISLNFFLDATEALRAAGHLKPQSVEQITAPLNRPQLHGQLHHNYDYARSTVELLSSLVKNAPFYECNFQYAVEDSSPGTFSISAAPNPHVEQFRKHPGFNHFICEYRRSYLQNFSTYRGGSAPKISERQCIFKGASRCVFEVGLRQ